MGSRTAAEAAPQTDEQRLRARTLASLKALGMTDGAMNGRVSQGDLTGYATDATGSGQRQLTQSELDASLSSVRSVLAAENSAAKPDTADLYLRSLGTGSVRKARRGSTSNRLGQFDPASPLGPSILGGK